VQGAGEHIFAKSTGTDHVDLFIGHSWKAGRWEKFFSLCTSLDIQFDDFNVSSNDAHQFVGKNQKQI
jgi:hypothetical protein